MAARTANDATRFTATGPHAHTKSTPLSSNTSSSNLNLPGRPSPPGETPQQKIARLRAAAAAAKTGKVSTFDRVVGIGRLVADKAHRLTAIGLIAATGLCGAVAVFSLGDMMLHNRRRRKEWMIEQETKYEKNLAAAREAAAAGIADDDQTLLLNRERARDEALAAQKAKKGIFTRAKESLFSGLSSEETPGGKLGARMTGQTSNAGEQVSAQAERVDRAFEQREGLGIMKAVEEQRRQGEIVEEAVHPRGGILDQEAQLATTAVAGATKSWTGWMIR
ncbi:hypothetical protein LTR50_000234 [Elasticomyces elasticus]|nr:hypothetical protein LTR50_000234 [Elasticomyces elasticus]